MPHNIAREIEKLADDLGVDRKRSIGDVARELKVETHIIRFWEEKFPQIKPAIGAGKRRYYYNKQLKVLKRIKKFLYEDGYTINGLQKLLKQRKVDSYKQEDLDIIVRTAQESKPDISNNNHRDVEVKALEIEPSEKAELEKIVARSKKNLAKLETLLHKSIL